MIGALRILLAAVVIVAGIAPLALACNEECGDGFVFSDREGVCVRVGTASS